MDADLRRALGAIAGARAVTEGGVVSPADAGQVAAVLRACSEHGARVAVVSGPAGRGVGAPDGATVLLSVSRLADVSVDAAAAVARAGAGAQLAAVREACEAAGRALTAAPARSSSPAHVGSVVARGAVPRWAISGVEAVLGSGETVRAGGTVQRDVTGYDLVAALLGSAGRLAVVTTVWFRLQPKEAASAPHEAQGTIEPGVLGEALRAAFDPRGVLVAAS
jgi:FAD/FMN-containing dehydrogenase